MQRFFDLMFSLLALLILSPVLVPVVVVLRLTGEGEIFYLQERIGRFGKSFKLFKFATMLKDSPNMGTGTVTVKGDPRVLPFGKFLRKTKINELPQLLNIFFGHMSVIGPRPLTSDAFNAYSREIQTSIVEVRPGLSGIGSIIFRNEEEMLSEGMSSMEYYRTELAPYKGAVEQWYVENQNLLVYFTAIALTAWVVAFPSSSAVWRIFNGLPTPPENLQKALNYPRKPNN